MLFFTSSEILTKRQGLGKRIPLRKPKNIEFFKAGNLNENMEDQSLSPKKLEVLQCPYCELKSTSIPNMKRYHFDNCNHKQEYE